MTDRRIPSFRHLHALVLHPDDNDRRLLARNLSRLGLAVHCRSAMPAAAVASHADLIFFDVDTGTGGQFDGIDPAVKLIALVGSETPGRLEWMLAHDPHAWLMKPIRSSGLYTAMAVAFHRHEQRRDAAQHLERLRGRAQSRDTVAAAVTLLMQRHACSEPEAFGLLRRTAMDRRMSLQAYCALVLGGGAVPERRRIVAGT